MNKLKHFLPTHMLRTMYNSLILTHLHFSILSRGLHSGRFPKLQKRAVRIITLNKDNAYTEPILKSLGLLKVNDIFTLQCLKCYFKCTHTNHVCFVLHSKHRTRHDHNTRQRHQPELLFSHTSRARKWIKCHIPLLLRSMPTCIIAKIHTHSIVLIVSQIILNSTCWPAMKKLSNSKLLRMRPRLSWHAVFLTIIYILLIIYLYRLLYTVYFVSHHVIAYAHVYHSLMFNNVVLHLLMFIIHLCLYCFRRNCIIVIMVTLM